MAYSAPPNTINANALQPAGQQDLNYPSWRATIATQFVNNIAAGLSGLPQTWDTAKYGDPRVFSGSGQVIKNGVITSPGVPTAVYANVLRWIDSGAWRNSSDDAGWMTSIAGEMPAPSDSDYAMSPEQEAVQFSRDMTMKNYNLNLRQQEFAEQKFALSLMADASRAYSSGGGGGGGSSGYASQLGLTPVQDQMTAYQMASLALQEKLGMGQLAISQGNLDLEKIKTQADEAYKAAVLALQNKQLDVSVGQFDQTFEQKAREWAQQYALSRETLDTSKAQFEKQFGLSQEQFGESKNQFAQTLQQRNRQIDIQAKQWQNEFDQKTKQWAEQYGLSKEQFEASKDQFLKSFDQQAKQFDENKALTLKQMDQQWSVHVDDLNQRKAEAASADERARIDQQLRQAQFDYQKHRDDVAAALDEKKFLEGQRQFNESLAFQKENAGFQRASQMADVMLKRGEIIAKLNADPNDAVERSYFTHMGVHPTGTAVNAFTGEEAPGDTTLPEVMAGNAQAVTSTGTGGFVANLGGQPPIPMQAAGGYTTAPKMIIGDHPAGAPNPEVVENPTNAPLIIHSRLTEGSKMAAPKGLPHYAYGTDVSFSTTSSSPYYMPPVDMYNTGELYPGLANELEINQQQQQQYFDQQTGRKVWDPAANTWKQTYDPTQYGYLNPFEIQLENSKSNTGYQIKPNVAVAGLPDVKPVAAGVGAKPGAAGYDPKANYMWDPAKGEWVMTGGGSAPPPAALPAGFTKVEGTVRMNKDGTTSLVDSNGAVVQPGDVRRSDGTYWRYQMADAVSGGKPGWVPVVPAQTLVSSLAQWNSIPPAARDAITSGKPTYYVLAPGYMTDDKGLPATVGGMGPTQFYSNGAPANIQERQVTQQSGWERQAGLPALGGPGSVTGHRSVDASVVNRGAVGVNPGEAVLAAMPGPGPAPKIPVRRFQTAAVPTEPFRGPVGVTTYH